MADVALAVASPLAAVTLTECAHHTLHMAWLSHTTMGPLGLTFGPYLFLAPLGGFAAYFGTSLGRVGSLSSIVGFTVALFCVYHFRGSLNWPGVFDLVDRGNFHLLAPLVIAFSIGALAGTLLPTNVHGKPARAVAATGILTACLWSWADSSRDIGLYSQFGYTRQVAVLAVSVTALIVWIFSGLTKD